MLSTRLPALGRVPRSTRRVLTLGLVVLALACRAERKRYKRPPGFVVVPNGCLERTRPVRAEDTSKRAMQARALMAALPTSKRTYLVWEDETTSSLTITLEGARASLVDRLYDPNVTAEGGLRPCVDHIRIEAGITLRSEDMRLAESFDRAVLATLPWGRAQAVDHLQAELFVKRADMMGDYVRQTSEPRFAGLTFTLKVDGADVEGTLDERYVAASGIAFGRRVAHWVTLTIE